MVWKSNDFDRYNQERIDEIKLELRRFADRGDHGSSQQQQSAAHPSHMIAGSVRS